MRFVDILTFSFSPIYLFLGVFVFIKNPKNIQNICLLVFFIIVSLWTFFLSMFQVPLFMDSLFWIKANYTISWFIFFSIFSIPFVFPKPPTITLKPLQIVLMVFYFLVIPLIIEYFLIFTDLFVKEVVILESGRKAILGPVYLYWVLYSFPLYGIFSVILANKYKNTKGIERLQLKYVISGFVIWTIIGYAFNIILPHFGIYQVWIGPLATISVVISLAYAIFRYRLMDINLVIRRGVIYSVLMSIIISIYSILILVIQRMFFGGGSATESFIAAPQLTIGNLFATVIVVTTIDPLKRFIENITDKYFFKSRIDTENALMTLGKSLNSIASLEELSSTICTSLKSTLKVSDVRLIIHDEKSLYEIIDQHIHKVTLATVVLDYLSIHNDIILLEELEGAIATTEQITNDFANERILLHFLLEVNGTVIVPLMRHNILAGFIVLGRKLSNDSLTTTDITLLQTLAYQTAIAVDNALLYSEMEDKINQRTNQLHETNTKLQSVNEKLEEAYGKLTVLDNAKSDFISMASHQLRTPVSVIRGYTSMLIEGDFGKLQDSQEHAAQLSLKSIKRLSEIIDDILNVSRIEGGKFQLRKEVTNLASLLHDVCQELELKAKEKNLQMEVIIPHEEQNLTLSIDKEKMVQVISNLVHNAINYTPTGTIHIGLAHDMNSAFITISDTGIGIPEDDIGKLFQRFSRLDNAKAIRPDGTGIGLYLVKTIVEEHQGTISVISKENEGSTFTVTIPLHDSFVVDEKNYPEDLTNSIYKSTSEKAIA